MDVEEVEIAIDELETRLERLRSLYEQYFLGIEKIEPTVARKDVDRRIWLLRREQIRNTARRFKLQTIIQRYNTFQQYWQRICREIENGTYKRHLLRAEKTFGPDQALTIVARKRFRNREKAAEIAAGKAADAQKQLAADLGAALDDKNYDPLEEAKRAVDAALGRSERDNGAGKAGSVPALAEQPAAAEPARGPSARPKRELGRLELDLDDDLLGSSPAPKPVRPAAAVKSRAPERVAAPVSAARETPPATKPAAPSRPAKTEQQPAPAERPAAAQHAAPARPASAERPAPPGRPAPPARPKPPARPPPPARAPAAGKTAPARPAPAGTTAQSGPGGPPAAPPRAGAARPPAPAAGRARPRPAAGGSQQAGMSDERVRELHARLVDAKKKTNDSQNISVDRLKKSLESVESKLRKRHGNRSIDFDVVIKDGKAVVKPIVR